MFAEILQKNSKYKNVKQLEIEKNIYQNELDRACFQFDMAFKYIRRRTAADKALRDKPFNLAKILKDDGYQRGLA